MLPGSLVVVVEVISGPSVVPALVLVLTTTGRGRGGGTRGGERA